MMRAAFAGGRGSQGAAVFGRVLPPALLALPAALRARLRVSLQTGADAMRGPRSCACRHRCRPPALLRDMAARLRDAHLVVTRAGATTIADLLVVGRPAIVVPIPQGGSRDEQCGNAEALERLGAGWCMAEDAGGFTAPALAARLEALFTGPTALAAAADAAARLGRPDAAARLADEVEALLRLRAAAAGG